MKKNPIGKYLLQNWYYYVFAFGSMALSVFLDMLAPLVTLHIVDDVLVSHKMELLWKYLAAFLLIGAAKALFQYIKEFLFDVSSVRVASQMRDNLFRHVQQLCPLPRRIEHRQPMLLLIGRDLCGHVHPLRKQADQFFVNVVDLISIVAQLQAAHILSF